MDELIKPGRYRHFKGREYLVMDVALHSETEQAHVVYRPLYGEARLWIRPLELFTDQKQLNGQSVARFERIGDGPDAERGPQQTVAEFCRLHQIEATRPARLLDLSSELGELAKVWLKASAYGMDPQGQPDPEAWRAELGDILFALLSLANESGVDAEQALRQALERYSARIQSAGHPGSDSE